MRTYLVVTGTLFALFAAMHVYELVKEWRSPAEDPWFIVGVSLIVVVSGGLSVWAFRLLKTPSAP